LKTIIKNFLNTLPRATQERVFYNENLLNAWYVKFFSKKDTWLSSNKNSYKGKRLFLLATGPSLNNVDLTLLKDEYTMGVNGIYKISNDIGLNFFITVSSFYYKNNIKGINELRVDRCFIPKKLKKTFNLKSDVSYMNVIYPKYRIDNEFSKRTVPFDFSTHPDEYIYAGGTVIFLALQIAIYLGFKEIILLGLDHNYADLKNSSDKSYQSSNFDKSHFDSSYHSPNTDVHVDLDAMERGYELAKYHASKSKVNIINATENSKLNVFKKRRVMDYIRGDKC